MTEAPAEQICRLVAEVGQLRLKLMQTHDVSCSASGPGREIGIPGCICEVRNKYMAKWELLDAIIFAMILAEESENYDEEETIDFAERRFRSLRGPLDPGHLGQRERLTEQTRRMEVAKLVVERLKELPTVAGTVS